MAQVPPRIFCPFPGQENPHTDAARAHLDDWVRRLGLVRAAGARRRFARADFAWFAARTYPAAGADDLNLITGWFAWLFLVDDQLDDGSVGRDLGRARTAMDGLLAVLGDPAGPGRVDPGGPAAVTALADLWARTAPYTTAGWRHRFRRHLADCFAAACWEAGNRVSGVVPDEAAYIAKRRDTGAIYVCMDLIEVVERIDLPGPVYGSRLFQDALDAASNVVCWTNDVYSLEKERALGEHHNLVFVVERSRGLSRAAAVASVAGLISTETRRFLDLEQPLLGRFPAHAADLTRYLAGMRSWMRGNLDWSSATKRYRRRDLATAGDAVRPESYLEAAVMGPAHPG